MANKVKILLLTAVIFLTIAGSIKMDLPGFPISDLRIMIPPVILLLSLLVIFDKEAKINFSKLLNTGIGLAISILFFLMATSLYSAPTTHLKMLSTIILSLVCFVLSYLLSVNTKTSRAAGESLIIGICIASVVVSFISLVILVSGEVGVEFVGRFVESGNFRYILYDLGRGRVYPIFPPTYFIGVITSVYLTKIKKKKNMLIFLLLLGMGIISLYAGNYRILSLVGTIGITYAWTKTLNISWWKIIPIVFVIGLIPALLLPTNVIKRTSLVDSNDVGSIDSRIALVSRYINIAIDNNFKAVGFGNATEAEDLALENETGIFPTNQNPHNIYLQLLVEGGLPIAITYGVMVWFFILTDIKLLRLKKLDPVLGAISLTCILFFLTSAIERHAFNVFVYIFSIQGLIYGKSVIMKETG